MLIPNKKTKNHGTLFFFINVNMTSATWSTIVQFSYVIESQDKTSKMQVYELFTTISIVFSLSLTMDRREDVKGKREPEQVKADKFSR